MLNTWIAKKDSTSNHDLLKEQSLTILKLKEANSKLESEIKHLKVYIFSLEFEIKFSKIFKTKS